jgi:hypothetical protein
MTNSAIWSYTCRACSRDSVCRRSDTNTRPAGGVGAAASTATARRVSGCGSGCGGWTPAPLLLNAPLAVSFVACGVVDALPPPPPPPPRAPARRGAIARGVVDIVPDIASVRARRSA